MHLRRRRSFHRRALAPLLMLAVGSLLAIACLPLAPLLAEAQAKGRKVEDQFAGKVVVSTKPFPSSFRSQPAFAAFLRQATTKMIWPDKDGKWRFEYMCFFRKPLDDLEVKVRFFDITDGDKRFVNSTEQYTRARGERVLASSIVLEKPEFEINRKYLMTVGSRGEILAQATFVLRGQGPHYSGKVTFTDEEAAGTVAPVNKD